MSTTSNGQSQNRCLPATDAQWFALIESEIGVSAADASPEYVCDIARMHADQVISHVDGFDLNLDEINWHGSKRLKGLHGRYSYNDQTITLSLPSLRHNGWQELCCVVRHELVHAWQHQHDKREKGCDCHDLDSFERWIDPLKIWKTGPKVTDYRYIIQCTGCNNSWGYHRKCETIVDTIAGERHCSRCGSTSDAELIVHDQETGEILDEADDYGLLEEHEKRVAYLPTADRDVLGTRYFITFQGIGKRSAEELCQEFDWIHEMVDGRELADTVRNVVPAQYHDRLWAELRSFADWEVNEDNVVPRSRPDPDLYLNDGDRIAEADLPPLTVAEMTENNETDTLLFG